MRNLEIVISFERSGISERGRMQIKGIKEYYRWVKIKIFSLTIQSAVY